MVSAIYVTVNDVNKVFIVISSAVLWALNIFLTGKYYLNRAMYLSYPYF